MSTDFSTQNVEMEESTSTKPKRNRRPHQRPRGTNSKQRNDDKFRAKVGAKVVEDYRAARNHKFTSSLPSDFSLLDLSLPLSFASRPVVPVVKRVPFSTLGIGLAVSELVNRFPDSFARSDCSIHSFYRTSLAQLELQRQVTAEGGISSYPVTRSLAVEMDSGFRNAVKAHPDNFKVMVSQIENYGKFRSGGAEYVSTIPQGTERKPAFVTFKTLPEVVRWLSDPLGDVNSRHEFFQRNSIPGAIVDINNWLLMNPNDIWPPGYDGSFLRNDCIALLRLLENMKTKFDQVAAKVSYSGVGKLGTLISVSDPPISIHYNVFTGDEPPRGKRPRVDRELVIPRNVFVPRSTDVPELFWYSSEPMQEVEATLGLLSLSGVTSPALEIEFPLMRVRTPTNSVIRLTEAWTSVFDEAVPRIART